MVVSVVVAKGQKSRQLPVGRKRVSFWWAFSFVAISIYRTQALGDTLAETHLARATCNQIT